MKKLGWKENARHFCNPLNVYCRGRELKVPKKLALVAMQGWSKVYKVIFGS